MSALTLDSPETVNVESITISDLSVIKELPIDEVASSQDTTDAPYTATHVVNMSRESFINQSRGRKRGGFESLVVGGY